MFDKTLRECLTFDDVMLVPAYSEVLPADVEVRTRLSRNIDLNVPIVSAAMDSVTESRAAIVIAARASVTESIAALTIGTLRSMLRESRVFTSTSAGNTSL